MQKSHAHQDRTAVGISHEGSVTHLMLNRPEKLNAVNAEMVEQLIRGLDEAVQRESRLVVFSGSGRAFSAGFDLSGLEEQTDADLLYRFVRIEMLLQKIYTAPMNTMAIGHGRCFGAGADIFCSCARRVAAAGTTFKMPGLQFGIVLGTRRFAQLVGRDVARELLRTSRVFTAEEGLGLGVVQQITESEDWSSLIETIAKESSFLTLAAASSLLRNTRDRSADLDQDLSELTRSAAAPGLADRIQAYVSKSASQ
ncbi:enoyl-CoA hydratase/isomerase family protein [Limibacillus halophilus]|uniref:Enoyl-CoA hydratase/carnithine racemase n=1 Tax=Limibacillus halophilus TaxID=1579333 RepID=A0A839ST63_9PROT|nr:enoyl-CoA hydratase/isomerase family protein [Limibacillus halophilus]MBB3065991.1 enoyl-CoA hydratase/carnithine racemase [Limibacillus halophilus]